MKVGHSPMPLMPREMPPRSAKAAHTAAQTQEAAAVTAPASSEVPSTKRPDGPPGLVKLAARFAAMNGDFKNGGQENAASRIQQNLARYQQTQALATGAASTTPTEPPAVPAAPESPTTTETAVAPPPPAQEEPDTVAQSTPASTEPLPTAEVSGSTPEQTALDTLLESTSGTPVT